MSLKITGFLPVNSMARVYGAVSIRITGVWFTGRYALARVEVLWVSEERLASLFAWRSTAVSSFEEPWVMCHVSRGWGVLVHRPVGSVTVQGRCHASEDRGKFATSQLIMGV